MIFLVKTPKAVNRIGGISFVKESETRSSLVFRGRAVALLDRTPAEDYWVAYPLEGEDWGRACTKLLYVRCITTEEAESMDDPERFAGHKLGWWAAFKKLLGIS